MKSVGADSALKQIYIFFFDKDERKEEKKKKKEEKKIWRQISEQDYSKLEQNLRAESTIFWSRLKQKATFWRQNRASTRWE